MPQRILIHGVTGSGKTTLARAIAERTGLPWTEADQLTWEPGWVPVEPVEQRRRISEICRQDQWVLDSAYSSWCDLVLARAELVVGLDYSRGRSLRQLLARTAGRLVRRNAICNGNVETLREVLSPKSIVVWHFRDFRRKRQQIREWAANPDGPAVLVLHSPRQTAAWLDTLTNRTPTDRTPINRTMD